MKHIVIIRTSATQFLNNKFAKKLMGEKFAEKEDVFKFLKFHFKRNFKKHEIHLFNLKEFAYFCNGNVDFDMREAYVSYVDIKKKKMFNVVTNPVENT